MPARNDFAPGEFCWIDLMAHDKAAAAAWYGELFGWTAMDVPTPGGGPAYAFFLSGENVVAGLGEADEGMKAAGVPPMWNSYVATADAEATAAKVAELGATVTVPVQEVPGFGKLAFFLDPEGASFAIWQATSTSGPPMLVAEPVSLSWNELMSRDTAKAREFYGVLFGWDFAAMPMGEIEYTMIKNAGKDAGGMMTMSGPQFEGVPAHWLVYFAVADCDAVAAKVEASGGKVQVPPMDIPVGRFAVFMDPQGGVFCTITISSSD